MREPSLQALLSCLCLWAFAKLPWTDPQSEALTHDFPAGRGGSLAEGCYTPPVPHGNLTAVSLDMSAGNGILPTNL